MSGTRASTVPNFTVTNPYAVNLNPSTHEGSKLIREFTNAKSADDDDKKLVVTTENAKWNRRDKRDKEESLPRDDAANERSGTSASGRLKVQQKPKAVLMTKKGMSQAEAQEVLNDLEN